ncbi:MAG TPA: SBBP repeat-containing protein [Bacteroidia bacterium]|jgi:hypothetical protein|nr:SBBP repeat-containing protein [Bacteroidia bacterium]
MKLFLVSLFSLLLVTGAYAQSDWIWARNGSGGNYNEGRAICTDTAGNSFVSGGFAGSSISFGTFVLTNSAPGALDIFLVKYDTNGNVVWAVSAGGNNDDSGWSLCTDASGNVFVTGAFRSSSITFGTTTLVNSGNDDVFIAKYDPAGNLVWAKRAGGTTSDIAYGICADPSGNIFITGYFQSPSIIFDSFTLLNAGTVNVFTVKMDTGGNVLWAKRAGGTNGDKGYAVSADPNGNVVVTGFFGSSSIVFDSFTLTNSATGYGDVFVAKYDSSGNVLWAKRAGGTGHDEGMGVSVDPWGNVFVTGDFSSSSISFGATSFSNPGNGSAQVFLCRYDANGNVLWAKSAGGTPDDMGYSVASDPDGNAFVTGSFHSPAITFGSFTLTTSSVLFDPMFIVKYDSTGSVICAAPLASGGDDINEVATDPAGDALIGGDYEVDPFVVGTDTLTLSGSEDIFVAKFNCSCTPTLAVAGDLSICKGDTTTLTASGASTYTWLPDSVPSASFSVSPLSTTTYSVIGTSQMGCSDTMAVTVVVNPVPYVALHLSAVDSQCVSTSSVLLTGAFPSGGIFTGIGVNGNQFSPSAAGTGIFTIIYTYTDSLGCSASAHDSIYVFDCAGISPIDNGINRISISPNPLSSSSIIHFHFTPYDAELEIYDPYGQLLRTVKNISSGSFILQREDLPAGIYFLQLTSEHQLIGSAKLIITD